MFTGYSQTDQWDQLEDGNHWESLGSGNWESGKTTETRMLPTSTAFESFLDKYLRHSIEDGGGNGKV